MQTDADTQLDPELPELNQDPEAGADASPSGADTSATGDDGEMSERTGKVGGGHGKKSAPKKSKKAPKKDRSLAAEPTSGEGSRPEGLVTDIPWMAKDLSFADSSLIEEGTVEAFRREAELSAEAELPEYPTSKSESEAALPSEFASETEPELSPEAVARLGEPEEMKPIEQMGFAALSEAEESVEAQDGVSFLSGNSFAEEDLGEESDSMEDREALTEGDSGWHAVGADSVDVHGSDPADNDADPQPTEFIEADHLVSIIESLLFSTDKPVSIATIKLIFKGSNVRTKDITRALDILASEYASAARGVTLEEINGGFQLRTKVDNAEYLRRLQKTRPFRLSGPALEVMSIVAYKQPVTKHEIDEIRGVESGHLLRALMERGMVNFGGKSDLPGKPMTYGTTRKFLEIFGLRNLRELPTLSEIDEILPQGIGETEDKEQLSDLTGQLSTELTASYSEGEDELELINEELLAIDTTSEFFEQEKQRERDRRERDRAQDIREKIVLGDPVEEKDRRWLDRYEAKLHAIEAAAAAGTPIHIPHEEVEGAPNIGGALERLSTDPDSAAILDESLEMQATRELITAEGLDDSDEIINEESELLDDLEANSNWEEDLRGAADSDEDSLPEV